MQALNVFFSVSCHLCSFSSLQPVEILKDRNTQAHSSCLENPFYHHKTQILGNKSLAIKVFSPAPIVLCQNVWLLLCRFSFSHGILEDVSEKWDQGQA